MFEVGDTIRYMMNGKSHIGKIVGYRYDEGNLWEVKMSDGELLWFYDHELIFYPDLRSHYGPEDLQRWLASTSVQ